MIRRSAFQRIATAIAAPLLAAAGGAHHIAMGAQQTTYKVGHLFFDNKAVPGSVYAYVWSGRGWVGLDPTRPAEPMMRKAIQFIQRYMTPDELTTLAVRVNGEWVWAAEFLKGRA